MRVLQPELERKQELQPHVTQIGQDAQKHGEA